jgi:C4-dicarboxylate-specific signal transduction histidine kinase
VISTPPAPDGASDPLGVVAGRAAQEIGSALTAIQVAAERLERSWASRPDARSDAAPQELAVIREQSGRLAVLARHLIELAQPPSLAPVPLKLDETVERVIPALERVLARDGVELQIEGVRGRDASAWVRMDPQQLQDILLALVANARRAVADTAPPRWIRIELCPGPTGAVQLRVTDSGPGVPVGAEERIFHPFVSSWGGAGMGLSRSRVSLAGQGGELTLERTAAGATAFVLNLESCTPDCA